jgi:hypothetical protein
MSAEGAGVLDGLAGLWRVLNERGWRVVEGDEFTWWWPANSDQTRGLGLFRPGPAIYVDEEDPDDGLYVEGPLSKDESTPLLRYRTVGDLIVALDLIEAWAYPLGAADIDPDHLCQLDVGS